ncbi:MAG TPA: DUF4198 domain-containing protein [Xanthomonadaceae bacterium]|nr:DUF4198 domain-containing protein [Xanthomonadaceae bacterium]
MKSKAGLRGFVAVLVIAGLVQSSVASAHAIWFAQRSKQLAMIYGVGADDLDAVKRLPLVTKVSGFDGGWQEVATSIKANGPIAIVDSDAPVNAVAAVMDYGVWAKGKDGEWYKKGRDEMPDAVLAERNYKYAVHIGSLTAKIPLIEGQNLQIVPVGDIPAEHGKPVTFQVLFKGKPTAGVQVLHDYVNDPDQVPQVTGADGKVTMDVRNQGLNVVAAIYVGPSDNATKYDRVEHRSTLSFTLPHQPE